MSVSRLERRPDGVLVPALNDNEVDPFRAAWPLRLWGIRHVRYWFCLWRVHVWARVWARHGLGLGVPNPSDLAVLEAIWRGQR